MGHDLMVQPQVCVIVLVAFFCHAEDCTVTVSVFDDHVVQSAVLKESQEVMEHLR